MKKGAAIIILCLGIIALGFFLKPKGVPKEIVVHVNDGYKNATYEIDGRNVALVNGVEQEEIAPDSASMLVTRYFGNEARGDLNGDGLEDVAFLLTEEGGGSGVFYYVVAAINTGDGYTGTSAVYLGDRIAPQTTEIRNGQIIVNYAERASNEAMTTAPSHGVSKYLKVQGKDLVEAKPSL